MEHKQTDNKLLDNQKQIKQIDYLIDNEKNRLKKIDSIQESIVSVTKNMNQCIDLLSVSIKGKTNENLLSNLRDSNKIFYVNMATTLDDESEISRKKINKLSERKETIIKQTKNKKELG